MGHAVYDRLIIMIFFLGGISLFFLVIGLRGIINKKPFLISSKWTFGLIILCFLPQILSPFLFSKHMGSGFGINQSGLFIFLILFMYRALIMRQAYVAYGITDDSLREALHYVFKKRNVVFEETLASIKLPSVPAELQVSIQSWMGAGQIRIKDRKDSQLLNEIVNDLNAYFKEADVKINNVIFVFYIIFSIFMLASPVLLFNLLRHVHN